MRFRLNEEGEAHMMDGPSPSRIRDALYHTSHVGAKPLSIRRRSKTFQTKRMPLYSGDSLLSRYIKHFILSNAKNEGSSKIQTPTDTLGPREGSRIRICHADARIARMDFSIGRSTDDGPTRRLPSSPIRTGLDTCIACIVAV